MREILVLYPGSSYEETIMAENIRDARRILKEKNNGKSVPKGTEFRYVNTNYIFPPKDKKLTEKQTKNTEIAKSYPGLFSVK